MARRTYAVRLELTSVDDLFAAPSIDPFDPRYGDHSDRPALDFIADEVYSNGSYRAATATFVVPDPERADLDEIRAAVRRWSSARARSARQDASAMRWRGLRSLVSGLLLFAVLILASKLLESDTDGVAATLSTGLEVAAWVVLWWPLDTLLWSVWQHRLDRRAFEVVRDMDVRLEAAGPRAAPSAGCA
ncbi:hypothetical protein [Nocardioides sp. YIM 152588]|uniref:hypothetical protein n=1 Tax=Nocardioides sp. YIM 152588 TaxID=3158259 RepID=UPI0032E412FD